MEISEKSWDIVIEPKGKRFNLNFKEVLKYKDLLYMYVHRDIVTAYKQTILGPLWFLIQPLMSTVMFMFVFGGIAKISTDGLPQPLFYMAGLLCWGYFSDCLGKASSTFSANAGVFSKVYFPRLVVPISSVLSSLLKFAIQLALFFAFYIYYLYQGANISMNAYALLFPLLVLMLAGLALGFGIIISSMTTKYRDVGILIGFAIGLWMYATPVIYPLSTMAKNYPKYLWVVQANPLTSIIETFKFGFLGSGTFTWISLAYSFVFTIVVVLLGASVFNKVERKFIDIV